MKQKIRQITDNIHDTIYLSELESELISTPYFYRLHDVYQSSTVYMTFPSNRTKRYEHSLGTMEVASSMLYSAVSNASVDTKKELFKYLRSYYLEILDIIMQQTEDQSVPYFTKCKDQLSSLFQEIDGTNLEDYVREEIGRAMEDGCFSDSALEHYQYYPLDIKKESDFSNIEDIFLYRCLLQAVRIVALFHDVGHPPYSHIIEEVLIQLYEQYVDVEGKSDWQKKQLDDFAKCLTKYITKDKRKACKCQTVYSKDSFVDAQLHERVGISLLQSAINDVIPQLIVSIITSEKKDCCKVASSMYYILVVEFIFAILMEKNDVFTSFHKIVDGVIDADRLDYIMRDSLNSGVDWGKIPYKRVINSAKLFYIEKTDHDSSEIKKIFVVAYPQKVSEDLEDLLLVRYKIYARINFHHRCMKTAVTLQSAVLQLAENYLNSTSEEQCINPDICTLWKALGTAIGDRRARVIQWNDSWLISALHKSLVKLNMKGRLAEQDKVLKENLEEILLNKKRYYSLFKRVSDSKKFIDKIFEYAEISADKLKILFSAEIVKYIQNNQAKKNNEQSKDILKNDSSNARDSIIRINALMKAMSGDLESLWRPFPLMDKTIDACVEEVLADFKTRNEISDYKIIVNQGKQKTGLPMHKNVFQEIYLYDGSTCLTLDDTITLRSQIEAIERNVLWLYVYFVPPATHCNIDALTNNLIDGMAKAVGMKLKERFKELFEHSSQSQ